jgi:hypothetical protein
MPVTGTPKQIMRTEMRKFKAGQLHSGSKKGPIVRNRRQAIAIGLSEAGQGRGKRKGGKQ